MDVSSAPRYMGARPVISWAALLSDGTVVILGPSYASKKSTSSTSTTSSTTSLMSELSLSSKSSSSKSSSSPVVVLGTIDPRSPALPDPTTLRNLLIVDAFVIHNNDNNDADGKAGEYIVVRLIAVSCSSSSSSSSSSSGEGGVGGGGGEDLIEMEIRIDIVGEGGGGGGGVGIAKMTAL